MIYPQNRKGGVVPKADEMNKLANALQQTYINEQMQPNDQYRQAFDVPTPWIGPFEVTFDPAGDGLRDLIIGPYRDYASTYTRSPIRDTIHVHSHQVTADVFELTSSQTIRSGVSNCWIFYKIDLDNFGSLSASDVVVQTTNSTAGLETDGSYVIIPLAFCLVDVVPGIGTAVTAIQQLQYGPIHVWKLRANMLSNQNTSNYQVIRNVSGNEGLQWRDVVDDSTGTTLGISSTKKPSAQ